MSSQSSESEPRTDGQTIDVYLGTIRNAWGRTAQVVAGTSEKAKEDVEERARELTKGIDAELPDEAEWEDHFFDEDKEVWKVEDWQIAVKACQVEKSGVDR